MKSKIRFKCEKGISLVVLIITVIVMFILAGVSVGTYVNYIGKSEIQKSKAELETISHVLGERYMTYLTTRDTTLLVGETVTDNQDFESFKTSLASVNLSLSESSGYYLLTNTNLKNLNIRSSGKNAKFIVNYKTREVINISLFKNMSELNESNVSQVYYNPNI